MKDDVIKADKLFSQFNKSDWALVPQVTDP